MLAQTEQRVHRRVVAREQVIERRGLCFGARSYATGQSLQSGLRSGDDNKLSTADGTIGVCVRRRATASHARSA